MNDLSAEVLINIFSHLHFVQKLECLLVCRKWAQILRDGYLFETIQVMRRPLSNELRTLTLGKSKCGTHPGKRCKRFLVHPSWQDSKLDIVTLATTYPNLSFLSAGQEIHYKPYSKPPKVDQFAGWKKSLQVLEWKGACIDILKQGVFNRLSTLVLSPGDQGPKDDYYDELFSYFGNLPALTHLTTYNYTPQIPQLEILHSNAPGLTSLTLERVDPANYVDLQSLNIKPAEKLTRLCLVGNYKDSERRDTLLEYIKLKYTHLDEFEHTLLYNRYPDRQRDEQAETEWTELISTIGPGLKTCAITGAQHTSAIPNILAKHTTQLEDLSVDVYKSHQILNAIVTDNVFCNLNSLSLKLLPQNFKLSCLKVMTQLKTLSLYQQIKLHEEITISLNSIASELPKSIKSLTLSYANIIVDDQESNQEDSNITHLKVLSSRVHDINTSAFLTKHFKKLYSLVLNQCSITYPMYLPNHHLGYAELEIVPPLGILSPIKKHLELTVTGKTQYFNRHQKARPHGIYNRGHRPLQEVLKGSAKDDYVVYFHFTCASLESAYFERFYLLI